MTTVIDELIDTMKGLGIVEGYNGELIAEVDPALHWNANLQRFELKHCEHCGRETSFKFIAGPFMHYRKCAKCMNEEERDAVKRLYD